MSSVWAMQDAKNKFTAVVDRVCQVEPQIAARRSGAGPKIGVGSRSGGTSRLFVRWDGTVL